MISNKKYTVETAGMQDLPFICELFEQAIAFQKNNHFVGWKNYDESFIRSDISNQLLFKIISDQSILCIFSICLADPLIWREKEKGDAVYLHRIILNRAFAGSKAFEKVMRWAERFALDKGLKYIRMDTWAENKKIIEYYQSYGFYVVEDFKTSDTAELPVQHRNLHVTLLEYRV